MIMKLPQEIEVWYIIPAIRRELARGLMKRGLKQRDIARIMGVTDAAVSHYFSSKRGSDVRLNRRVRAETGASVDRILKGSNIMREIQRLCLLCKKDGIRCHVHKHHGAPRDCRICFGSR
jgi:predicted transcriptional regulator